MATSVLSHRWENLWTYYHGNLVFTTSGKFIENECSNYVRSVNKVLDTLELACESGMLDSFTVLFDVGENNLSSVDRWVRFALEKRRVKRLCFDPSCLFAVKDRFSNYDFLVQCYTHIRQPSGLRNIQALTSLHFERVNVSGEAIEHFLSNCPLLQSLVLIFSLKPLNHLRVSGGGGGERLAALTHLSICNCTDLTTIEISAPNLVSFNYIDSLSDAKFDVLNVLNLVEFSVGALGDDWRTPSALDLISCFSSHLQKLELLIYDQEPKDFFMKLIELNSLKHLTVILDGSSHYQSVLVWIPLLKACPLLHKFTLRCPTDYGKESYYDLKLAMYFLKNIVSLEEISLRCREVYFESRVEPAAISLVAKLKQIIPKEVKLVVSQPDLIVL